MAEVGI